MYGSTYICAQLSSKQPNQMIKKFALLATMAALFVACSEDPGTMEKAQTEEATPEMNETPAVEAEVVTPENTTTVEGTIEEMPATEITPTETPAEGTEGAEPK